MRERTVVLDLLLAAILAAAGFLWIVGGIPRLRGWPAWLLVVAVTAWWIARRARDDRWPPLTLDDVLRADLMKITLPPVVVKGMLAWIAGALILLAAGVAGVSTAGLPEWSESAFVLGLIAAAVLPDVWRFLRHRHHGDRGPLP